FSSRRRHTRSKRDWSSDVCSSDLTIAFFGFLALLCFHRHASSKRLASNLYLCGSHSLNFYTQTCRLSCEDIIFPGTLKRFKKSRSEERRVGKEGKTREWRYN